MKMLKDDALSFLNQVFLYRGSARFSVGVIAGFTLDGKPELLPEPDCMAFIKDGLGKDTLFDPCMPKPYGEVLAAGKCYTPDRTPVPAMLPAIRVGSVQKRLAVFGNRCWNRPAGVAAAISEPEPFAEMEMTWKRAFGGPEYELNPEGKGLDGDPLPLPNVELPDHLIAAPGDRPAPAGFEPMGMGWPARLNSLGTFDDAWKKTAWPAYPDDFNFLYFNRAPADQRIEGWFRGDEPVEADHLHPARPYIRTRLPGVRVRCFVVRSENGEDLFAEVDMRLETVWLLPNALFGALIWRGVAPTADDESSDIPLISAFIEPLDARRESLEYYLAKVRAMQAEEGSFAAGEAPAAGTPAGEAPGMPGLPGIKMPAAPGVSAPAAVTAAAGIAGAAGLAVPAMAEEGGPPEAGLPGAVPVTPSAEMPPAESAGAAAVPEAPPAGGPQPVIARTVEEIPKVEIPEISTSEEKIGPTAFEKNAEAMLNEARDNQPDQQLFSESPPLPDMPPEALKAYIESLAARSEADAREFMKRHGFDMDAPVEYPPSPPGVGRLMDHDPIPENTPVGQIPLILQEISGDFRKRFDDLAKKHNIDPHALIPEEKRMPFSNAAELERHLRNTGYDNPEMFEELRRIDALHKEADARLGQYFAILGTSRASLAANAEKEAGEQRARQIASDEELREFMRQLAAGTVPGLSGSAPPVIPSEPEEPSFSGAGRSAMLEEDFKDDPPEEDAAPRPEPPQREDILKRLEGGESLAGASLAGAELSEADLSNRNFQGTDFSGANLEKADFTNSILTGATFSGAILTGAIFSGASPGNAIFAAASGSGANFAGVNLANADFSDGDFTGADFSGADMTGAKMNGAVFDGAKFNGSTIRNAAASKARFMEADLSGADFSGANLAEADMTGATTDTTLFSGAILTNVWFSSAHGAGTMFTGADMRTSRADGATSLPGADFTGALLTNARWADADLSGARFHGDDLTGASFMSCVFAGADLGGITARGAVFQKSDFTGAKVSGSDLFQCSLRKANLTRADFSNTNLYGADFYMATVVDTRFDGANLTGTLLAEWRPGE